MKVYWCLFPLLTACASPPQVQVVRDRAGHIRAEVTRVDGAKHGPVHFFAPDGPPTTTGHYVHDSRDGTWATMGPKGDTLALVTFEQGRKHGLQAYWASNGQLLRSEYFSAGKPHGTLRRFFSDGSPRQITHYTHGVPDGVYMEWYKVASTSVALTAGQFRAGERTGRWTWFYGNGKPQCQGLYQAGHRVGHWRWWDHEGRLTKQEDNGPP